MVKKLRSFPKTLAVCITLSALVPALLTALPLALQLFNLEEQNAFKRLTSQAGEVATRIESHWEVIHAKLDTLSEDSDIAFGGISHLLLSRVDNRLQEFLQKNPTILSGYFLGQAGEIRTAVPLGLEFSKHLPFLGKVKADFGKVERDRFIYTDANFNAEFSRYLNLKPPLDSTDAVIFITRAINDYRDQVDGTLVMALPLKVLGELFHKRLETGVRGELWHENQLVYQSAPRDKGEEIQVVDELSLGYGQKPLPLTLKLYQPVLAYQRPIYEALGWVISLFAALFLTFAILSQALARLLLKPLQVLTQKIKAIRDGEASAPTPDVRFSEFAGFLNLLDDMKAELKSQMEEVAARRAKEAQLQRAKLQVELSALQFQMNPHFLFNALNSIVAMISEAPQKASDMLVELSTMYQKILEASSHTTIPLAQELTIIHGFIRLQKLRFGERLQYQEDLEKGECEIFLPGMLLQTLIENAIKHGIEQKRSGGKIWLKVQLIGDEVIFKVINTGKRLDLTKASKGHGLLNTKLRLKAIYDEDFDFSLKEKIIDQNYYTFAEVKIPRKPKNP